MGGVFEEERDAGAEGDADDAADGAERDGFDQKLDEDVVALGADGFAHADFAGALGDGDQHDVHHADAADDEAYRRYREHEDENQAADFLPELEEIVGSENRKVVRLVVGEAAFAAEKVAHFVDGLVDIIGIAGFGEDDVVFLIWVELAERGDGHVGGIVFGVGAAGDALALLLKNANHGEELAVNGDFLADGVAGRLGKKSAHWCRSRGARPGRDARRRFR